MKMIAILEETIGKKAEIVMEGMQQGDVLETFADITDSLVVKINGWVSCNVYARFTHSAFFFVKSQYLICCRRDRSI